MEKERSKVDQTITNGQNVSWKRCSGLKESAGALMKRNFSRERKNDFAFLKRNENDRGLHASRFEKYSERETGFFSSTIR